MQLIEAHAYQRSEGSGRFSHTNVFEILLRRKILSSSRKAVCGGSIQEEIGASPHGSCFDSAFHSHEILDKVT